MKKIIYLGWLIVFLPAMLFAQDKVEAPVWKAGDRWVFTQGNIEVLGADKNSYALNFSKDTCVLENVGFQTIIFEKSTLNRIYFLREEARVRYKSFRKRILNFPFSLGKQWEDASKMESLPKPLDLPRTWEYSETYKVLGWENVVTRLGTFKALKLEYWEKIVGPPLDVRGLGSQRGAIWYWYSPEVKYFVKCQYDMGPTKGYFVGAKDWELTSFELKK